MQKVLELFLENEKKALKILEI